MALTFSVPDTELSLTVHNRRNQLIDNVFQGTAYLRALRDFGGVKMEGGGLELVSPLQMAKNSTVGSFDSYDLLDTTPQDNQTSSRTPWRYNAGTISLAWTEQLKNAGPGKLIDWVTAKTDEAMMSIKDKLNVQLMATQPAAGSKDPASIDEIIDSDPTADPDRTTSIGSIGNANTWWRNKFLDNSASFSVADMATVYNDVSDGQEFPTFILTSSTVHELYENSLVNSIRYVQSRTGDQGFTDLLFKRTPVVWDPQIGQTERMYFINTTYFKLCIHSDGDFKTTDFIEPDNQAAKVAKILWAGNQECTNRRRQGVLFNIA